jgi:hypothetical protein
VDFKYNEELYGEKIFTEGFQTNYTSSELVILVKYLKEVKQYRRKDTEKFLYEFCKKYIEGFNEINYFKVIDRAIKMGRKKDNKLIVIKNIPIFKEELKYIDNLHISHEHKKLLLSFLVNKKIRLEIRNINNDEKSKEIIAYFEGDKKRYGSLFRSSNVNNKYKINEMIHELVNEKIIQSIINGGIVLEFLYDIYETWEENIEVRNKITGKVEKQKRKHIIYDTQKYELYELIKDFDNIGYVFDYYKGENKIKKCQCCGKYIKQNGRVQKYCNECAKEKIKERDRTRKKNKEIPHS